MFLCARAPAVRANIGWVVVNLQCEMTEKQRTLEGLSYRAYGIRCGEREVDDLARDPGVLAPLIDHCNRVGISPDHLLDIAEDFVARLAEPEMDLLGK